MLVCLQATVCKAGQGPRHKSCIAHYSHRLRPYPLYLLLNAVLVIASHKGDTPGLLHLVDDVRGRIKSSRFVIKGYFNELR
jgi:hypothetical protein